MPNQEQGSDDRLSGLQRFLEYDERRKMKENERAIEALCSGKGPTAPEICEIINSRIGTDRLKLMSHHPYWEEKKLREGLDALINTAQAAFVDICRHEAALTSYSQCKTDFQEHIAYTVENPFQKEVMAFCGAAFGLIDALRRIAKIRSDLSDQLTAEIQRLFSDDLTKFIKDLRKNLSHGSVVVPGWSVSSDKAGTSGAMIFFAEELLLFGEWSSGSKRYIANSSDGRIDVREAVNEYHKKIQSLSATLKDLFARNVSATEKDFFDIEDSYRRVGARQFAKILVGQVGKGRNPYDYLHRFFQPQDTREILRRPSHSKEQVNFIISLLSVRMDCDEDLRSKMYKIFEVATDKEGD